MKNLLLILTLGAAVALASCSDNTTDPSTNNNNNNNNTTTDSTFWPLSIGSKWTYTGFYNYTVEVTGDTVIDGKTWMVLTNTRTGTGYARWDGNTLLNFGLPGSLFPGQTTAVNQAVNSTWTNDINAGGGVVNHYVFTNTGKTADRTVLGKTYTNVYDVHLVDTYTLNGTPVGNTEGDYYYSVGVGLVEVILQGGNEQLQSYTIK